MRLPEHPAKTPSAKTGLFATLPSLPRAKGTRAASRHSFLLIASVLVLLALVLNASTASAGTFYAPAGGLDGSATANGSFGELISESVAINGKNGHILIADSAHGVLYDYESLADTSPITWDGSNTFAGTFGAGRLAVAVDDSTGDVYIADTTHAVIVKFDQKGNLIASFGDTSPAADGQLTGAATPAGSFSPAGATSFGIAVDQESGELYVIDAGNRVIDVFDSSGAYQSQVTAEPPGLYRFGGGYTDGIALDNGNDRLYLSDSGSEKAFEFSLAGNHLATLEGATTPGGSFGGYLSIAAANDFGTYFVSDTAHAVVDVFDSSGAYLTQVVGLGEPRGVAVDQASGTLWVSDNSTKTVRAFKPEEVDPPTVSLDPVSAITGDSAHFSGTVNSSGSGPANATEYRFQCSPECPGLPGPQPVTSDGTDKAVNLDATGLEANTEYSATLLASSPGGSSISDPVTFTTAAIAPTVGPATSTASDGNAVLRARLTPHSSATTFHFEYGPTSAYGASTAEIAGGAGSKAEIVGQQIKGLDPDAAYHYRIVATNSAATAEGPDRIVATGPLFGEGRGYEMVSPPEKLGNDAMIDASRTRAATDGDAIQFLSLGAFGDARGAGISTEYMAVRGSAGWRTHSITPPNEPQPAESAIFTPDPRYSGELSDDLATGVYSTKRPLTGATDVANIVSLYLRHDLLDPGFGSYELITAPVGPVLPGFNSGSTYIAASKDYTHILFKSNIAITSDTPAQPFPGACASFGFCEPVLYEYSSGTRLVGLVPVGPATSCSGSACVVAPRSFAASAPATVEYAADAISDDGQRIFFTAPEEAFSNQGPLYMRENGNTTLRLNASERSEPATAQPAEFWAASADGSKAFFTSEEPLVDSDTDTQNDLYKYDRAAPESQRLTLISVDDEPSDGTGGVADVIGASRDGAYVYFTNSSQLAAGEPPVPQGELGLFAWHQDYLAYVDAITAFDEPLNASPAWALFNQVSRVSPDGKHLSYLSTSSHVSTQEASNSCDTHSCWRLYVYSANQGESDDTVACASCRPDGAPTSADVSVMPRVATGGAVSDSHINRSMTTDGRLVFFSTSERLVPDDVNGRVDVYVYVTTNAQVHLISPGRGNEDSYFLEATPNGSDVFFATRERLVASDDDNATDIYDARIGGGFSIDQPPGVGCEGDACQPPPALLGDSTPASSNFVGVGDPRPHRKKRRHHNKHHRGRQPHVDGHRLAPSGRQGEHR